MADDEASIRRILETRLSMIGYQVVTACDGNEALELFRHCDPDPVVLDVMMPKLDGYGVIQELRKDSDVPIVILTPLGDVEASPKHEGVPLDGPSAKDVDSASLEDNMLPPAGERRDQALYPSSGR